MSYFLVNLVERLWKRKLDDLGQGERDWYRRIGYLQARVFGEVEGERERMIGWFQACEWTKMTVQRKVVVQLWTLLGWLDALICEVYVAVGEVVRAGGVSHHRRQLEWNRITKVRVG